jgi:hypothetical protein
VVLERGGVVLDVGRLGKHTGGGEDAFWLMDVARKAQNRKAVLLAACTHRFVRNKWYWSTNLLRNAQASEGELHRLGVDTFGVPLMTLLAPDAAAGECRAFLTRWGQEVKGKKGGGDRMSGNRKRRKEAWLARVLELKQQSFSLVKIADRISQESGERITAMTVRQWVRSEGT